MAFGRKYVGKTKTNMKKINKYVCGVILAAAITAPLIVRADGCGYCYDGYNSTLADCAKKPAVEGICDAGALVALGVCLTACAGSGYTNPPGNPPPYTWG